MHSALPDMGQLRGLGMKAVLKCGQHIVFDLPADVLHRCALIDRALCSLWLAVLDSHEFYAGPTSPVSPANGGFPM